MSLPENLPAIISTTPMTLQQIAEAAQCSCQYAGVVVSQLRQQLHVAAWERSARGPMKPLYLWGAGADAPKPPKYTAAEKCRRYRKTPHGKKVSKQCGRRWRRSAQGQDYQRKASAARYTRKVFEQRGVAGIDPLLAKIMGAR